MTRDIPGCQIEGFLQIAHLKSDLIWQQESPAEKWKRLLHPNQTFLYNAISESSEYQQCSTTISDSTSLDPLKQFSHVTQCSRLVVRIGVVDRIFAIITLSLSGAQNSHGFSFLRTNLDGMVLKNEKHHLSLGMLLWRQSVNERKTRELFFYIITYYYRIIAKAKTGNV